MREWCRKVRRSVNYSGKKVRSGAAEGLLSGKRGEGSGGESGEGKGGDAEKREGVPNGKNDVIIV